jgi:hypothetical protein
MSSTQMLTLMNAAIKAGPPPVQQQQQAVPAPALAQQYPAAAPQLSAQISTQVSSQLPVSTQGGGKSEKSERDSKRPAHAGGPSKASALPSGLEGKDLPPANPWKDAIQRIQSEEARQQQEEEKKKVGQPMLSVFKVSI